MRATRTAELAPGTPIRVEVVGELKRPVGHEPKVGDTFHNLASLGREDGDRAAWHIEDPAFLEAARKDLADWDASCSKPDDTPRTSPTLAKA
jgi:hypothetical protein